MLSENKRLRCKKSLGHSHFTATAHVVEEWVVDDQADFEEVNASIETTHAPNDDSYFTCAECDGKVEIVDVTDFPYYCDNCGMRYANREELAFVEDLEQRVDEGGPMPSGECVRCGALCYRKEGL